MCIIPGRDNIMVGYLVLAHTNINVHTNLSIHCNGSDETLEVSSRFDNDNIISGIV
jgi:hypothetical protein